LNRDNPAVWNLEYLTPEEHHEKHAVKLDDLPDSFFLPPSKSDYVFPVVSRIVLEMA